MDSMNSTNNNPDGPITNLLDHDTDEFDFSPYANWDGVEWSENKYAGNWEDQQWEPEPCNWDPPAKGAKNNVINPFDDSPSKQDEVLFWLEKIEESLNGVASDQTMKYIQNARNVIAAPQSITPTSTLTTGVVELTEIEREYMNT